MQLVASEGEAGLFAVGDNTVGVIAIGGSATGVIAIGIMARGFIAIGALAIGAIAIGCGAAGGGRVYVCGVGVGGVVWTIGLGIGLHVNGRGQLLGEYEPTTAWWSKAFVFSSVVAGLLAVGWRWFAEIQV